MCDHPGKPPVDHFLSHLPGLLVAVFQYQPAPAFKESGGGFNNFAQRGESLVLCDQCAGWFKAQVTLGQVNVIRRNIRRIGANQIKPAFFDTIEPVALYPLNIFQPEVFPIDFCDLKRRLAHIGCNDPGAGQFRSQRQRHRAAARTRFENFPLVDSRLRRTRLFQPAVPFHVWESKPFHPPSDLSDQNSRECVMYATGTPLMRIRTSDLNFFPSFPDSCPITVRDQGGQLNSEQMTQDYPGIPVAAPNLMTIAGQTSATTHRPVIAPKTDNGRQALRPDSTLPEGVPDVQRSTAQ